MKDVREEATKGQDTARSSNLVSKSRNINGESVHLEQGKRNDEKPGKRYYIFPALPSDDPGPPPDGGTTAWLQVLAGHLISVLTVGLVTSFGVFQPYYEVTLREVPSAVSWIGTTQIFMFFVIGAFSGRASDAGLVHEAVFVGTGLIVIGIFMTSLSSQYYQLLLSQGICVGLGMGILFMPGLSVSASYFKDKKSLAVGIVASGAGSGGLVYPAMVQQLLPRIGFGWTIRYMGFVTFVIAIVINLLLRMRIPPRRSGPLADWRAFTETPYIFFVIGFFFVYWAVYFPFYYIDKYGEAFADFTYTDSIRILLISNGLGIPGRIVPGFIASRWCGPLNTAIPTATLVAIISYCWIDAGDSRIGMYAFAAIYGFFASAIQSLFVASLAGLTNDLSKLGTRMGMVFSVVAFACLTGSPIAGALIQAADGTYLGAQIWGATAMLLGAASLTVARVGQTGFDLRAKI